MYSLTRSSSKLGGPCVINFSLDIFHTQGKYFIHSLVKELSCYPSLTFTPPHDTEFTFYLIIFWTHIFWVIDKQRCNSEVPTAISTQECKPVLHRLLSLQLFFLFCDIGSLRLLREEASFVTIKNLVRKFRNLQRFKIQQHLCSCSIPVPNKYVDTTSLLKLMKQPSTESTHFKFITCTLVSGFSCWSSSCNCFVFSQINFRNAVISNLFFVNSI